MNLQCPRCEMVLQEQDYEGESVRLCPGCYGYWMKKEQLDAIVNNVEFAFSKREASAVLNAMDADDDVDEDNESLFLCPVCNHNMVREKYHDHCPVRIDSCPEHGVWLDTGEVKNLQVFVETKILGHEHE
ncbi:MAG: hypothetical protein GX608_00540 [Lentisphaerae bacterium]|nr:hypothetical protein [Lentisphaerota bacterium]